LVGRRFEECQLLQSTSYLIQGRFTESLNLAQVAIESSHKRGDVQIKVLGLSTEAMNFYSLSKISEFCDKFKQIRSTIEAVDINSYIMDITLKINYYGLKCLFLLHTANVEGAYASMNKALSSIKLASTTCLFTFQGYINTLHCLIVLYYISESEPNIWPNAPPQIKLKKTN